MEKKALSKKSIVLLVLSVLSLVLGILFATPVTNDIAGINFDTVATGLVLILAGFYLVVPLFKSLKGNLKIVIFIELIAILVISLFGFILPEFIKDLKSDTFGVNFWVGLILVMHAVIHLLIDRTRTDKLGNWAYSVYILIAVVGGFLIDSKSINLNALITVLVVVLFIGLAVYLAIKALFIPKTTKKVK